MSTKLAIAIDLDQLRALMREFVDHVTDNDDLADEDSRASLEWTFETFLQWLIRKRQETINATDTR